MDEEGAYGKRIRRGSRIIPLSRDVVGKFDTGVTAAVHLGNGNVFASKVKNKKHNEQLK